MQVTRCICHNVSFAQLWVLSQNGTLTLDELSAKTACCTGCGLCKDYVQLMLLTGITIFPPMHPNTMAALIARSRLRSPPPTAPPTA